MDISTVTQLPSHSQPHRPLEQPQFTFENTAAAFLNAWKQGVALAGQTYFGDGTQIGLNKATCRWDLRPDLLLISNTFNILSANERIFLAAMVSFYDTYEGGVLLKQIGVLALANLGPLDHERRAVIASLIMHYHGW